MFSPSAIRWTLGTGIATTLLFCAIDCSGDETNLVLTTNWVTASAEFREIGGQLYNAEKSIKFETVYGKCTAITSNGVFLQKISIKEVYETVPPPRRYDNDPARTGNFLGGGAPIAHRRKIGDEEIPGETVFIQNFPPTHKGEKRQFRAMPIGRREYGAQTFDTYDFGLPHIVQVIKTNRQFIGKP